MRDDSIERTRALEQLAQMKRRMDEKTLSGFLEKRRNHHSGIPSITQTGLSRKMRGIIEN